MNCLGSAKLNCAVELLEFFLPFRGIIGPICRLSELDQPWQYLGEALVFGVGRYRIDFSLQFVIACD